MMIKHLLQIAKFSAWGGAKQEHVQCNRRSHMILSTMFQVLTCIQLSCNSSKTKIKF